MEERTAEERRKGGKGKAKINKSLKIIKEGETD